LRVVVLLPEGDNPFMATMARLVAELCHKFAAFRIEPRAVLYPLLDPEALAAAIRAQARDNEGLAVVALDGDRVRSAIDEVEARGVPVVTLLSDVPESRRTAYVGMDNVAAGRTAGALLGGSARGPGVAGIFGGSALYAELRQRVLGCEAALSERAPELVRLPVVWDVEGDAPARRAARALLARQADLLAI
jgi:LacI family transcriptional regulator